MKIRLLLVILCSIFIFTVQAQVLKAGFDKSEYLETLKINQKAHIDLPKWEGDTTVPMPQHFEFKERSQVVAFDNLFDFWMHRSKPLALIAVRGSIPTGASFLANLYAAMIPASGELELKDGEVFQYTLSEDPRAAVHAGWCIAMAHMAGPVVQKIDSCYKAGIRDVILTGHSQGGGITFLLSSYLYDLKQKGRLPADLTLKTYSSAGPKPGNLFFSYDYQRRNADGWAYNVVNTADWVPDVPFSIQTVDDFTNVNPFRGAKQTIKQQKLPARVALNHVYRKLSKPAKQAQRNYERYLGNFVSKAVQKQLPDMKLPAYYRSNYYMPAGDTIVLYPGEDYFQLWSNDPSNPNIWQHHFLVQYLYLAEKL